MREEIEKKGREKFEMHYKSHINDNVTYQYFMSKVKVKHY